MLVVMQREKMKFRNHILFVAGVLICAGCTTPTPRTTSYTDSGKIHYSEYFENKTLILPEPLFRAIVSDLKRRVGIESISSKFHNTIANIILNMCLKIRKTSGFDRVALSGGVFQNSLLLENTYVLLDKNNFKVFTQHRVPPNDGGIALGQVVIANEQAKK